MSKISFIKSDERKYNVERCLSLIKSEIMSGLKNAKRIVVKPNCVVDNLQPAATNVDALDAVLGFIKPYASSQIILAEGVGMGDTLTAFKNYRYFELQEKYDFAVVDLNEDDYEMVELIDRNGKPLPVKIAKTVIESDYLISVTPIKTHNEVVYTGAIKNVAVGALLRSGKGLSSLVAAKMGLIKNYKLSIHQGYKAANENIKRLFQKIPLKLAVLDAYEAMEGDGPINGSIVASHFAIASSDPIAADWLACQMMGIEFEDVGYLCMLENEEEEKSDYFVIGDNWKKHVSKFKMHSNYDKMRLWR